MESLLPQGLIGGLEALRGLLPFVEGVAPFAFAALLLVAIRRVRDRAAHGQAYLETLEDRVGAIRAVFLGANVASEPIVENLSVPLDRALGREEVGTDPDLEEAIIELRNGLTNYADNLSIRPDKRCFAHVRVADVFSAQIPERFVAAGRASGVSRLSVQAGLAFSVFFIMIALINLENVKEVISSVTYKFAFTILGLATSLWIQYSTARAVRRARGLFVAFEDAFESAIQSDFVSPLSGSFQLLEQQTALNHELRLLLVGFNQEVNALSRSAAALRHSADSASKTLETAQEASKTLGEEIEAHLQKLLDDFSEAQKSFLSALDEHAGKATKNYTRAIGLSARAFAKEATDAGTSFKSGMSELGSGFRGQITAAGSNLQQNISNASETLGSTAKQAGNALDTGVTAALARFSSEFTTATESYSKGARASGAATLEAVRLLTTALEELNRSLGGAQTRFERFGELQIDRIEIAAGAAQRRLEKLAADAVVTEPFDVKLPEVPDEPSEDGRAQADGETETPPEETSPRSDRDGHEL